MRHKRQNSFRIFSKGIGTKDRTASESSSKGMRHKRQNSLQNLLQGDEAQKTEQLQNILQGDEAQKTEQLQNLLQRDEAQKTEQLQNILQGDKVQGKIEHLQNLLQGDKTQKIEHLQNLLQGDKTQKIEQLQNLLQGDETQKTEHHQAKMDSNFSKPPETFNNKKPETDKNAEKLEVYQHGRHPSNLKLFINNEVENEDHFIPRRLFLFGITKFKNEDVRQVETFKETLSAPNPMKDLPPTSTSEETTATVSTKKNLRRRIKKLFGFK